MRRTTPRARAIVPTSLLIAAILLPLPLGAQYFGRNKVNYESFDWRVLESDHFDIHYYPVESLATADAARMSERWYVRLSGLLRHRFDRKPIIFYANHADFQQTNVISGFISQGTGGVTESGRDRVILPFTGVYADNDHVIGHELVHAFQYDMDRSPAVRNGPGIGQLPLWLIEGMAEYLSLGRDDPNTAMWLRDAALRNDLPTIKQLTSDPRYFPYRYGQALWAYIGGKWGDPVIGDIYRASLRGGWDAALRRTIGISSDSLSREWLAAIRAAYMPLIADRTRPTEVGDPVLVNRDEAGDMNLSPTLSPDGRFVAFLARREIFTIDLYVADARTGRILKRLTSPNRDTHFDALSFISSAGSWSPDGNKLAFVVFAEGDNELAIFDVPSQRVERRIRPRGVGSITDPAWSPDGRSIVFSGTVGGVSDLFLVDVQSQDVRQLTNDRHAELQPAWSPDGSTIAFSTDRGAATSFERLAFGPMRLATMPASGGEPSLLPGFEGARHISPQYSPDGRDVFFVADREGISDVYRLALGTGELFQVTRVATGISGITALSPALTVSRGTGRMLFSVFDNSGQGIYGLDSTRTRGQPVAATAPAVVAGILPPTDAGAGSIVERYVGDPVTGLPSQPRYPSTEYRSRLRLDYLGSPGVGLAVNQYGGTGLAGGIAAYFGDMLGNRTVGAALQATGSFKDFGGQLFYQNTSRRWAWLAAASHSPYLSGFTAIGDTAISVSGGQVPARIIEQQLLRAFVEQGTLAAQYPFSTTRRFEISTSYSLINYDIDVDRLLVVGNQVVGQVREDRPGPPGINYGTATAAFVGDYSFFGFTSPVAGGRYRFEASPAFGGLNFQTLLADYRRYLFARPVTFAFRGLHYGRYGKDAERDELGPLFLGRESLIRGYALESFDVSECTDAAAGSNECPEFDRLVGSRIAVASAELRIPLFGNQELGLINLPYLPTEISPFVDAGVAWSKGSSPDFRFDRSTTDRVPVVSAGVAARINVLGFAVFEIYYAHPFQRPGKGAHFGFQLAPGW